MSERNDSRFREDVSIMFAMYCDENGLSLDEGVALADDVSADLDSAANDRAGYIT